MARAALAVVLLALPVAAATSPPGAPATSSNLAARPTLLVGLGVQKSGSTSMYSTLADAARRAAGGARAGVGAPLLLEPRRKEINFWDDAAFAARAPSAAELREYEVRRPDAHPEAATNTP